MQGPQPQGPQIYRAMQQTPTPWPNLQHIPSAIIYRLPRRATTGSAVLDICANTRLILSPEMGVQMISSDFKGSLPKNTVGLLLGRSSAAIKGLIIHPGVIDPDYKGEVKIMVSSPRGVSAISPEDRIAQILLLPSHHASFPSRGLKRGNQDFGSIGIQIRKLVSLWLTKEWIGCRNK